MVGVSVPAKSQPMRANDLNYRRKKANKWHMRSFCCLLTYRKICGEVDDFASVHRMTARARVDGVARALGH